MIIEKIIELDDGSAEVTFQYTQQEAKIICNSKGWKRLSKKRFQTFVVDALKWCIENEGKLKELKDE